MQPRLIGFLCQRGAYAFFEAGHPLLRKLPRGFQALPVTHLAQIHAVDVIKAFRLGAQGVLLVGCEACKARREAEAQQYESLARSLAAWDITAERFHTVWCSSREPEKFFEAVATMMLRLEPLPRLRLPRTLDETIVYCG